MNIDSLTIAQAREVAGLFRETKPPTTGPEFWVIGKSYFLRTVTHHFTGRYVGFNGYELLFEDVAWIADDGRFSDAVANGNFNEVEPCPDGVAAIGRASLIDAHPFTNPIPRSRK